MPCSVLKSLCCAPNVFDCNATAHSPDISSFILKKSHWIRKSWVPKGKTQRLIRKLHKL